MEILIELNGEPTKTHCSQSSSINPCNYLSVNREKCRLFNTKLTYDFDAHAYKRCQTCTLREYEEDIF